MHCEGVHVDLKLKLEEIDAKISDHTPPVAGRPKPSGYFARSRFISVAPRTAFTVEVKLPEHFLENDIMVVIKCGSPEGLPQYNRNYQAYCIPRNSKPAKYTFLSFDLWENTPFPMREEAMNVPAGTDCDEKMMADPTWLDNMTANLGCISVFVVRGLLNLDSQATGRALTDAPSLRPTEITDVAVINQEWFDHEGYPTPYAFEFRNLASKELEKLQTAEKKPAAAIHSEFPQEPAPLPSSSRKTRAPHGKRPMVRDDDEQPLAKRRSEKFGLRDESANSMNRTSPPVRNARRLSSIAGDEESVLQEFKQERQPSPVNQSGMRMCAAPLLTPPEQEQPNGPVMPSNVVDLTGEDDTLDQDPSEGGRYRSSSTPEDTKKYVTTLGSVSEDEEDVRDQLQDVALNLQKIEEKRRQAKLERKLKFIQKQGRKAVKKENSPVSKEERVV